MTINGLVSLASYGYYGGDIGSFLSEMERMGFFSYLLPFLLIFALVNGILNQMKLFKDNKSINGIIAFAVSLMALQFDFVPVFFSEIFPRLGVGLAVILALLILGGLFLDPDDKGLMYTLLGIGAVILIIVLVQTAGAVGWHSGYWWYENWKMIAGVVIFLILFAIAASTPSNRNAESPLAKALRGG